MTIHEMREKRAKAWNAAKAFLDSRRNEKGVLSAEDDDDKDNSKASMLFSRKAVNTSLVNKLRHRMIADAAKTRPKPTGRKVDDLYERLNLMTH